MNAIETIEQRQLRKGLPRFKAGDSVRVHFRVIEGTRSRVQVFEGSPGDAHQRIDGYAFRMRIERGKLLQQPDAISFRFAEADDSSAANGNADFSHRRERAEAVVIIAGRDNLPVELRRSIEVMVVSSQARAGQAPRLRIIEHAERAANFHAEFRYTPHHFKDIFKILALLYLPPRRAHAEASCSFAAGALGKLHHLVHRKQAAA